MKILTTQQIRELDQITIRKQYNNSWELMEKASEELFHFMKQENIEKSKEIILFCGAGNNGGDGLALSRMLLKDGFSVTTYLLETQKYSKDNLKNQELVKTNGGIILPFQKDQDLDLPKNVIVIDALFGSGLNRALGADWKDLFEQIRVSKPQKVYAIDMPSGLLNDMTMKAEFSCLTADLVLTFQTPKLSLLLPDNKKYVQSFKVLDIGLDNQTIEEIETSVYFIDKYLILSFLKTPNIFSHKGTFGRVLIVGGSYGSIGAPVLASKAAMRTGCGLVTCYLPECGYEIIQSSFNEAMCLTDKHTDFITNIPDANSFDAVAAGMGLGRNESTKRALLEWLPAMSENTLILDADALNILAETEDPFGIIPKGSILTPHPKELERLIGTWKDDFEKLEKVRNIAGQYQIIFVIKGAYSAVVCPDQNIYFNSTGNWGMATAGSGDVLSGIIASLLAQKYTPIQSAILGVYLHGLAGDSAIKTIHPHSLIASDIIQHIGNAYFEMEKH